MIHVPRCVSGTKKLGSSLPFSAVPCVFCAVPLLEDVRTGNCFWCTVFTELSVQQVDRHGCLQVHPGAMEEEAVGRDAVPAARALLAVPPAVGLAPGSAPHATRQSPQAGIQGQAR